MKPTLLTTCVVASTILLSCSKESPVDNPQDFVPQWILVIDNSNNPHEWDISTRYAGINNWPCFANPPHVYVGAVFPASSFARSFDREISDEKRPIGLSFDFPIPYTTEMQPVKRIEYLKKVKEAIVSEEYQSYHSPTTPYIARLAELKSLSNLEASFPDNPAFGQTFRNICEQKFDPKAMKSLLLGQVLFRGFSVSMDTPQDGIFLDEPADKDNLIYTKTLTYGATAYFVVASKSPFKDVLSAFQALHPDAENIFNKSQIVLLTLADLDQNAIVSSTFDDLTNFLKDPFRNGHTYGYPVYCSGYYVKDNSVLTKEP